MSEVQEVYRAKNPTQGGMVVAMLEQNKIKATVDGSILASAGGGLPLGWSSGPRVWVSENDFQKAREIIVAWEKAFSDRAAEESSGQGKEVAMWTCPECSKEVEFNFEMCWNCQYNRTAC